MRLLSLIEVDLARSIARLRNLRTPVAVAAIMMGTVVFADTTGVWVRVVFKQVASGTTLQLSELAVYSSDGTRLNTPMTAVDSAAATNLTAKQFTTTRFTASDPSEGPKYLFDNNTSTKLCKIVSGMYAADENSNNWPVVTMRLANGTRPLYYNFASANDSFTSRSPTHWRVDISTNGVDWMQADEQSAQTYPTTSYTWYNGGTPYPFTNLLWTAFTVETSPTNCVYTGAGTYEPTATVKDFVTRAVLTENTHYTLAYTNNTAVGTASVVVTGINAYDGFTATKTFSIDSGYVVTILQSTIETDFVTPCEPEVVVSNYAGTVQLTDGVHYQVSYSNNTNVGTGHVVVTGLGDYLGNINDTPFTIVSSYRALPARYTIVNSADAIVDRAMEWDLEDGNLTSALEDGSNPSVILDFGTPRHVRTFGVSPRLGYPERLTYFKAYGSDDKETWTLIHTNTASPTYGVLNHYLVNSWDGVTAYRYVKVNNIQNLNVAELIAFSDDMAVRATADADGFAATAVCAADASSVTFRGTLTCSKDGPAVVYAFVAEQDFGDDYDAWRTFGKKVDVGSVAEYASFTATFDGLGKGRWHWRLFAVRGSSVSSCQPTMPFSLGTKVVYPVCYVMNSSMQHVYNGATVWGADVYTDSWFVFDFKDCDLRQFSLDGVRCWGRVGFYSRSFNGYVDFGWDSSETTDWDGTFLNNDGAGRLVYQVSGIPDGIAWSSDAHVLSSASVSKSDPLYSPFMKTMSRSNPPRYIRFRDFYQGGNLGEFEFRVLKRPGMILMVK